MVAFLPRLALRSRYFVVYFSSQPVTSADRSSVAGRPRMAGVRRSRTQRLGRVMDGPAYLRTIAAASGRTGSPGAPVRIRGHQESRIWGRHTISPSSSVCRAGRAAGAGQAATRVSAQMLSPNGRAVFSCRCIIAPKSCASGCLRCSSHEQTIRMVSPMPQWH